MKKYKYTYLLDYEVEAETEQDAVYEVVDLIRCDWPEYLDNGELTEVQKGTGPMAEFKVRAIRTDGDKQKVQLVIHDSNVVIESKKLHLMDKTYEGLFAAVKLLIEEVK